MSDNGNQIRLNAFLIRTKHKIYFGDSARGPHASEALPGTGAEERDRAADGQSLRDNHHRNYDF